MSSTVTAFAGRVANQRRSGSASRGEHRVQHERREGEVVDTVDVRRGLPGVAVVGVHLGQHPQPQAVGFGGEVVDEREGLGVRKHDVPAVFTV